MRRRTLLLVALTLAAAACATSGNSASRLGSANTITAEELATVPELNCYEAVQRLRPSWLRTRGRVSMSSQQGIKLYVDGMPRGYASDLVSMRANAVERMRRLSATEATSRYGTDHVDGAILVTLRKG